VRQRELHQGVAAADFQFSADFGAVGLDRPAADTQLFLDSFASLCSRRSAKVAPAEGGAPQGRGIAFSFDLQPLMFDLTMRSKVIMRTNRALQSYFGKLCRKATLFGKWRDFALFFNSSTFCFY
jgi:hypothetical protein